MYYIHRSCCLLFIATLFDIYTQYQQNGQCERNDVLIEFNSLNKISKLTFTINSSLVSGFSKLTPEVMGVMLTTIAGDTRGEDSNGLQKKNDAGVDGEGKQSQYTVEWCKYAKYDCSSSVKFTINCHNITNKKYVNISESLEMNGNTEVGYSVQNETIQSFKNDNLNDENRTSEGNNAFICIIDLQRLYRVTAVLIQFDRDLYDGEIQVVNISSWFPSNKDNINYYDSNNSSGIESKMSKGENFTSSPGEVEELYDKEECRKTIHLGREIDKDIHEMLLQQKQHFKKDGNEVDLTNRKEGGELRIELINRQGVIEQQEKEIQIQQFLMAGAKKEEVNLKSKLDSEIKELYSSSSKGFNGESDHLPRKRALSDDQINSKSKMIQYQYDKQFHSKDKASSSIQGMGKIIDAKSMTAKHRRKRRNIKGQNIDEDNKDEQLSELNKTMLFNKLGTNSTKTDENEISTASRNNPISLIFTIYIAAVIAMLMVIVSIMVSCKQTHWRGIVIDRLNIIGSQISLKYKENKKRKSMQKKNVTDSGRVKKAAVAPKKDSKEGEGTDSTGSGNLRRPRRWHNQKIECHTYQPTRNRQRNFKSSKPKQTRNQGLKITLDGLTLESRDINKKKSTIPKNSCSKNAISISLCKPSYASPEAFTISYPGSPSIRHPGSLTISRPSYR